MGSNEMIFKWKNHAGRMRESLKLMRVNGDFVDVTLWCEKRSIRAHKCLLAAGSPYFEEVFKQDQSPQPIIVFKNMKYDDLLSVVTYIYEGAVTVSQGRWRSFMETAEMLLVDMDGEHPAEDNESDREADSGTSSIKNDLSTAQKERGSTSGKIINI